MGENDTGADADVEEGEERIDAHLQDIEDGCGCTEVWEHTSAAREDETAESADD